MRLGIPLHRLLRQTITLVHYKSAMQQGEETTIALCRAKTIQKHMSVCSCHTRVSGRQSRDKLRWMRPLGVQRLFCRHCASDFWLRFRRDFYTEELFRRWYGPDLRDVIVPYRYILPPMRKILQFVGSPNDVGYRLVDLHRLHAMVYGDKRFISYQVLMRTRSYRYQLELYNAAKSYGLTWPKARKCATEILPGYKWVRLLEGELDWNDVYRKFESKLMQHVQPFQP
jgi:hypothetical protein